MKLRGNPKLRKAIVASVISLQEGMQTHANIVYNR